MKGLAMTDLNKPVKRVSHGTVYDRGVRQVIIILRPPNILAFRAKGCRKEYPLTAEWCYRMAVEAEALAMRKARQAARKLKYANRK